jgi:NAD-dependent SIR2 family protein deacetylase
LSKLFCPIESEVKMGLQQEFQMAQSILIVTGAGISVASGISPFRKHKDAVWERDIVTKGTFSYFCEDPVASWQWYRNRFANLVDKKPNPAHFALVQMEKWASDNQKEFLLVTQNIDTLHRKAGSKKLIEIHGRSDCVRCCNPRCIRGEPYGRLEPEEVSFSEFDASPSLSTLPTCPVCNSIVRAHVLWFDETYDGHADYQYERVLTSAFDCHLIVFIGTSFSVGITDSIWRIAKHQNIPMYAIDPSPSKEYNDIFWIEKSAEKLLPSIVSDLEKI